MRSLVQVKWSKIDKYKEVWLIGPSELKQNKYKEMGLLDQVKWSKINIKKCDYWIK